MFILGLLPPLVIQVQAIEAQPYGDTEIVVYDGDFLGVPRGDAPPPPAEPPVPDWVVLAVAPVVSAGTTPLPELPL